MSDCALSPTSASSEAGRSYALSSFLPAPAMSVLNPIQEVTVSTEPRSVIQEPPPAHSQKPASAIQKNPYQSKSDFHPQSGQVEGRPRQAHSNKYNQEQPRSHMLVDMLKGSTPSTQQQPPIAHNNSSHHHNSSLHQQSTASQQPPPHQQQQQQHYADNRSQPLTSQTYSDRPQSIGSHSSYSEPSPSVGQQLASYPDSPHALHHQQQHHPSEAAPVNRHHTPGATVVSRTTQPQAYSSYNKMAANTYANSSPLDTMKYDAVTPPLAQQQQPNRVMSLTDFADISSNQQKIPMSAAHGIPHGIPHHLHHQPQHSDSPHPIQSPPSLENTNAPHPIQAVADSTTKPKKASSKKGRKKKSMSPPTSPNKGMEIIGNTHPYIAIPQTEIMHQPGGFSTISADHIGLSHIGPGMTHLAPGQLACQEQQPVFMTNTFGNSFLTPKDHEAGEVVEQNNNPLLDPEHEVMFSESPKHQLPRTKAEQKQMPSTSVIEDDEFVHLSNPNTSKKIVDDGPEIPPANSNSQPANPAGNSDPPKSKSKDSSFQSSFLSFLQGKKPETLSSVTNSAITSKPELPKYIPDPRPRVDHVEKTIPTVQKKEKEQVVHSKPKAVVSEKSTAIAGKMTKPTLTATTAVTFSDDEGEKESEKSAALKKSVQTVLSKLEDKADNKPKPKKTEPSSVPVYKIISTTPAATPQPKARGKPSSASKKPAKKKTPKTGPEDEPPLLHRKIEDEDFLPMREKSSRKAKDKAQQKKKSKKAKYSKYSDSEDSDDVASMSSSPDSAEENYDSDKDPCWMPFAQDFSENRNDSDDGKSSKRSKSSKRLKSPTGPSQKRRRHSSSLSKPSAPQSPEPQSPGKPRGITEEVLEFLSDDDELPHVYEKGSFVIDRNDLVKFDSFPVWKIDAGRLLQKYELINREGKILHKSLSTYSSWSDNIRERYKAIAVEWIHRGKERDQDIVRVLDDYLPRPIDERLEEDPTMQAFNVYVQILVSQALEPGFLRAITNEEDDYYSKPSKVVDCLLAEKKEVIAKKVKWTNNLQESVEKYPFISMGEKDQAPSATARPIFKAIQLSGPSYCRSTLEEQRSQSPEGADVPSSKDFLVGNVTAQFVSIYHKLHHFKFTLLKRCKSKVSLLRSEANKDQSDILDQCLQNRAWVHRLYHNFQNLLKKASESLQPSATTSAAAGTVSPMVEEVIS